MLRFGVARLAKGAMVQKHTELAPNSVRFLQQKLRQKFSRSVQSAALALDGIRDRLKDPKRLGEDAAMVLEALPSVDRTRIQLLAQGGRFRQKSAWSDLPESHPFAVGGKCFEKFCQKYSLSVPFSNLFFEDRIQLLAQLYVSLCAVYAGILGTRISLDDVAEAVADSPVHSLPVVSFLVSEHPMFQKAVGQQPIHSFTPQQYATAVKLRDPLVWSRVHRRRGLVFVEPPATWIRPPLEKVTPAKLLERLLLHHCAAPDASPDLRALATSTRALRAELRSLSPTVLERVRQRAAQLRLPPSLTQAKQCARAKRLPIDDLKHRIEQAFLCSAAGQAAFGKPERRCLQQLLDAVEAAEKIPKPELPHAVPPSVEAKAPLRQPAAAVWVDPVWQSAALTASPAPADPVAEQKFHASLSNEAMEETDAMLDELPHLSQPLEAQIAEGNVRAAIFHHPSLLDAAKVVADAEEYLNSAARDGASDGAMESIDGSTEPKSDAEKTSITDVEGINDQLDALLAELNPDGKSNQSSSSRNSPSRHHRSPTSTPF